MTWGGNKPSNYSFLHLSILSRPTIAHTLEIQAIESWWNPSTTMASILVMQPSLCSSDCSWLNIGSDTEGLAITGNSISSQYTMRQAVWSNRYVRRSGLNTAFIWVPHWRMQYQLIRLCKVLRTEYFSELWQGYFFNRVSIMWKFRTLN